jgi:hypothetical protein
MDTNAHAPDQLIVKAAEGRFTKDELAGFLAIESRRPFLDACARIEKQFTEDCAAKNDPCLESGCSARGEICLQPLLHAGSAYFKACAAAWLPIFREPKNRADSLTG